MSILNAYNIAFSKLIQKYPLKNLKLALPLNQLRGK